MTAVASPPRLSVMMSCYNAQRWLVEAVDSVLAQSMTDFEFIVIDDGSTDATVEILGRYQDPRIRLIRKPNTGLADSLNVGLAQARGRWIARIDVDDLCEPERFMLQTRFLEQHRDLVLLGSGHWTIGESGERQSRWLYPAEHRALLRRLERIQPMFSHSSAMFDAATFRRLGGYNPSFRKSQDWDSWIRFAERGRIACLPLPLVSVRTHPHQISSSSVGHSQPVYGTAAAVCHFLRLRGAGDPSQAGDSQRFQGFVRWIEDRMNQDGVLQRRRLWANARAANEGSGRLARGLGFGWKLLASGDSRRVVIERVMGLSLPRRLAGEWLSRQGGG